MYSLHSNSALDVSIKGQMIRDVLNLAGFMLPKKEDVLVSSNNGCTSSSSGSISKSRSELIITDLFKDKIASIDF